MKVSKLVGERFKETPSDAVIPSHVLMIRGGYIKYLTNGIYSELPPMRRITRKIEMIIKEEMDKISEEVRFPVALPASLWEESGRYQGVGKELLRFTDRHDTPMLLGMTHEEAAVHMVREYGESYQRYPISIYQIQTKFRDEARPRGGLIRVREFTMKDAYTFHTSKEDLEAWYQIYFEAYERIFARAGLSVISVASDSGMMGGSLSHEFMYLTPVGEDSLALCSNCDYKSNIEAAENIIENESQAEIPLEKVHTPNVTTMEELANFFGVSAKALCKTVVYAREDNGALVIVFMRGDMEANETKLRNFIGAEIVPATLDELSGVAAGFIGPYGLNAPAGATVLFDASLKGAKNLIAGANEIDYHYKGFSLGRDGGDIAFYDLTKAIDGGICPNCGQHTLQIARGIEVGNIFQLGDKYTRSMGMQYTDENGEKDYPIMGCYGIGVGRMAASILEEHRDENGPIWPMTVAPWQVQICALRIDDAEVKAVSETIYAELTAAGIEVLYDERAVSPGIMFNDADLFGVPLRVVVSPRNLKEGKLEVSTRDKSVKEMLSASELLPFLQGKIAEMM
ncbi:MAG: proline--tRNA ligase [Christensenellaceae bacterium]|jgi:prolyl-tRNA synthetase